jgi:hypothetical protein
MLPTNPLGDRPGRHLRISLKQLANLRLDRINPPALRRPPILARPLSGQRPPHRVAAHALHPGDHLDRHPLRPVQPADLSPILH